MKILVTGGNGQLGRSLHKISNDYPQYDFLFTDMPEADITDKACITELVRQHSIGLIINCAAYTAVDKAESEPELAERINVLGPMTLAEVAAEHEISLIHISTDYVFGGESCHPLHENTATAPTGVYGRTKLAGEKAVQRAECKAAIIRTAWLYSEFGNNFVKTMLRLGTERDSLNVVYDQLGTPTYATDLARAILVIAEQMQNPTTQRCEIYHYSNDGAISWYDFTQAIFEAAGITIPVQAIESALYPTPAQRPAYSVLAKDKIKAAGATVPYWKTSLLDCLAILGALKK